MKAGAQSGRREQERERSGGSEARAQAAERRNAANGAGLSGGRGARPGQAAGRVGSFERSGAIWQRPSPARSLADCGSGAGNSLFPLVRPAVGSAGAGEEWSLERSASLRAMVAPGGTQRRRRLNRRKAD